jgi:hypothetical protein
MLSNIITEIGNHKESGNESGVSNVSSYMNIARSGSFQLELLTHLQAVPLVINKLCKESVFNNCDYSKAFDISTTHYGSRRHQAGLLRVLENFSLLPNATLEEIKAVLSNTSKDEVSRARKMLLWYQITETLQPQNADIGWISAVGSLLSRYEKEGNKTAILQDIVKVKDMPKIIQRQITRLMESGIKPTYEVLMTTIQNGYTADRFAKLNINKYDNISHEDIIKELSLKALDSDLNTEFQKHVMQDCYVKDNRFKSNGAFTYIWCKKFKILFEPC